MNVSSILIFFFQAEDGIRDVAVTGVQTCALPISPNSLNSPAVTGTTKYSESSRSSTPPCPGMSDEESLSPTSRLNSDSTTSPVCAATATAAPTVTSWRAPRRMATRSSTSGPYTRAAASAPTLPPIAPAHVSPGGEHRQEPQRAHEDGRLRPALRGALGPNRRERNHRCRRVAQFAERLHSLPARHVVQLARPEYAEAGEESRQDPAAQPQHHHGCGDGRDREGDSHEQVARHYTVTLPNRRSARGESRMASNSSRRVTSGHSSGVMYS